MKLHIRNMVSLRSRMIVEEELNRLGLDHSQVEPGEVEVMSSIPESTIAHLKAFLNSHDLELIQDKKSQLIEKIKRSITEMVHNGDKPLKTNFSNYLSGRLMYDYTYMANLFSKIQGVTIEHYIILLKIERVKELLAHSQLTIKEISYKLHYSSVAHLSNQFKKVTGFTPSHFKQSGEKDWLSIDNV